MVNKINIRLMKAKDLKKLADIYTRAYKIYGKWEKWNAKEAYKLLKYYLKKQSDLAFLAEYRGKIAGGFVAGIRPWWDGNHLTEGELFVDPDFQKKGIGKLLLKTVLEKSIKKYNATIWEATTFKKTVFPLIWYKNLGFNEITEWTIIGGNIKDVLKNLSKK